MYADDLIVVAAKNGNYRKHCKNGVTPLENIASEYVCINVTDVKRGGEYACM